MFDALQSKIKNKSMIKIKTLDNPAPAHSCRFVSIRGSKQLIHRRGTKATEWLWGWKLLVERWKRRSDTPVAFQPKPYKQSDRIAAFT